MTGFERIKATFKRQPTDRVAFYPIVSALAGKLIGVDAKTYYTDFDKLADAQIALFEETRQDVIALMGDLFMEVEAMGAEVEFPEDDVPRLRTYLLEDKGKLGSLDFPALEKAGRIPGYLAACTKASTTIKESPVGGVICGPWTLAAHLRGAENLIIDTATDPDFVHELMRFTVEIPKRLGEAVKNAGAGLSLSEAPASISLISPKIFREFVLPYEKEVISHLKEKRTSVTVHVCGIIDPIMEDLASMGAVAISMDEPSSLEKMFEVSKGRVVVVGNVPTNVFLSGTRDDMEREVKRCLAAGKKKEGFILSSGCELSPRGDIENVKWFCELASALGKHKQGERS
jgi:uroporphyrinogen decarboxylase